ncbi:hypothetical protein Bca101_043970 [Brassica carinata]
MSAPILFHHLRRRTLSSSSTKRSTLQQDAISHKSQRLRLGACSTAVYSNEIQSGERSFFALQSHSFVHDQLEPLPRVYHMYSLSKRLLSSSSGTKKEELELDLTETDDSSRKTVEKKQSELFKAIVSAGGLSVGSALDKWVEEGNEINRTEVAKAMLQLRRRHVQRSVTDMIGLTNQNNELKFRLQAMEQQAQLCDTLNEALTGEVQRLKLAIGETSRNESDRSKMQSLNAEMFQQLNISLLTQQPQSQQNHNGTMSAKPESNES